MKVYLMGSMRNAGVPAMANALRDCGFDTFDDWYSCGPEADDHWQAYEKERGRPLVEALHGEHARHVFEFDKMHIDASDVGILVLPAGRSAHIELGYMVGQGKRTVIYYEDEPERFDVMYKFASRIIVGYDQLVEQLRLWRQEL